MLDYNFLFPKALYYNFIENLQVILHLIPMEFNNFKILSPDDDQFCWPDAFNYDFTW